MVIDTHCHIYLPEFEDEQQQMLSRARSVGIGRFLMPAIDNSTHKDMLAMESAFPGECIAMMGLHPCSVKSNYKEELEIVKNYIGKRKFVAVGEIGLDFYWDKTFTEEQYSAFHTQIEWAMEKEWPIVIHSRESIDECIQVVSEHKGVRGVFHCFSGTVEQAEKVIGLGFYLGIGGVVTFKNSGLDKVMKEIAMDHVVLETDAPYLAPVPFRGKRNECSYISYVVEKLALIKGMTKEEIEKVTTMNAQMLFKL